MEGKSAGLTRPREPVVLTHLQRERHAQYTQRVIRTLDSKDLRQLRAYLLDVVSGGLTGHLDLATLRGELIHAELKRREGQSNLWRRVAEALAGNPVNRDYLSRFPDLEPPVGLRKPAPRR